MNINKYTRSALFFIIISIFFFCISGCNTNNEDSFQALETKKIVESFIQAFNIGDADACIGLLSGDIITEQKVASQDVKSQDARSVHEALKSNISLKHKWKIIEYLENTKNAITLRIEESGEDIKLTGVDFISFEITFEVKEGKIAKIISVADEKAAEQIAINTAGGIGANIDIKPDKITILSVIANSPAEKAGLKQGYDILAIDGIKCSDMKQGEQMIRIRGPVNSKVLLNVRPPDSNEAYDVELIREDISKLSNPSDNK